MLETTKKLISLVPPPANPVAAVGDWGLVEKELGGLPADYQEIVSTYGAGRFCRRISVVSPFVTSQSPRQFWLNWVKVFESIAHYGVEVPYSAYPSSPGLLPCGNYKESNVISWLTSNKEPWRIVYYGRSEGFVDLGLIGLGDFVLMAITGASFQNLGKLSEPCEQEQLRFAPLAR